LVPALSATVSTITDIRTTTGLTGAERTMAPGELLSAVGFIDGERRRRRNATYGILTDVWDSVSTTWKGTRNLTGFANIWQNGTSNINLSGSAANITALTIADPGYSYYIIASANFRAIPSTTWASPQGGPGVDAQISTGSLGTGTTIGFGQGFGLYQTGIAAGYFVPIPANSSGPFTGATTLWLSANSFGGTGGTQFVQFTDVASKINYLFAEVVPA
jgi:hypothetical protein